MKLLGKEHAWNIYLRNNDEEIKSIIFPGLDLDILEKPSGIPSWILLYLYQRTQKKKLIYY